MDRRRFLLTSLAGTLAAPRVSAAQQAAANWRAALSADDTGRPRGLSSRSSWPRLRRRKERISCR